MSSSSSFRARLESLPLRYSAPAGGYAPMPSPDDAPGIGDRGEEAEAPEAAGAAELTAPKIGESRASGLRGEVGSGLLGRGWTTP